MIIEDITLTGKNEGSDIPVPTVEMTGVLLGNVLAVKSFIEGTDSMEWLEKACYDSERSYLVDAANKELTKAKKLLDGN